MAWSLFTIHADLKPLTLAVERLASVGVRILGVLERKYPPQPDRSRMTPAGPENWSVESEHDRITAIIERRSKQLLGAVDTLPPT